jgi:hypothetical protein
MSRITGMARWISLHYSEFSYKDLVQDGCRLVLELKQKKGEDISLQYLEKAINNYFSKMVRDSHAKHKVKFVDLSTIERMPDKRVTGEFDELENNLDREKFLKTIKDDNLISLIRDLEMGYKPTEIAARNRTSIRTIYRQLKLIKDLREVWENK